MDKISPGHKRKRNSFKNLIIIVVVLALLAGIPWMILSYQAKRSGSTPGKVLSWMLNRTSKTESLTTGRSSIIEKGEKIDFLDPVPVGQGFTEPPLISNLTNSDLDKDGLPDIIVCDAKNNFVSWIRQYPAGTFTEKIAGQVLAPAHASVYDFDSDGDNDILVAALGILYPSNDKIGKVLILENRGDCTFISRYIAENIARVSDVRAGDLDNDGDTDFAVAQFGYDDGETRWIENTGNRTFKSHILQNLSGPINVEILDLENDGDLDIISLVSQEWEQIFCYLNDGKGNFQIRLLWGSDNEDFGSSGIYVFDFNGDDRQDILFTNGDAFDYIPPRGRPWHGIQWLENEGSLKFTYRRLCTFIGAYGVRPDDIDRDGDPDLFAVSGFNLWDDPEAQSFIWLENINYKSYILHNIASTPTHLLTIEPGDFNGDGLTDFVTGGMHSYPPFDRMSRITLWINNGKLRNQFKDSIPVLK